METHAVADATEIVSHLDEGVLVELPSRPADGLDGGSVGLERVEEVNGIL